MSDNLASEAMSAQRLMDENGMDFVRIEFPRTDDRPRGAIIEPMSILSKPSELRSLLENRGCEVDPTEAKIGDVIRRLLPKGFLKLSTHCGWTDDAQELAFAFPDEIVGAEGHYVRLANSEFERCLVGPTAGRLRDWKTHVAKPALASPIAALFILAAFVPPLLRFSRVPETFILNVAGNSPVGSNGNSSSGKTTATMVAASVWGNPLRCRTWNVSDRGAAELAASNNSLLLVLDDAEKAATKSEDRLKRVHDLTHLLTSGQSRDYSVSAAQLGKLRFECVILSSSPWSIEAAIASVNGRSDGDRARLLEIPVHQADEGGIFAQPIWGNVPADTRGLADALKAAAGQYHGKAGRKWVRHLVSKKTVLRSRVSRLTESFAARIRPEAVGVEARILFKFGLMYAAGVLASEAKVLPWSIEKIRKVAHRGFVSAMSVAFPQRFDEDVAIAGLRRLTSGNIMRSRTRPLGGLNSSFDGFLARAEKSFYVKRDTLKRYLAATQPDSPPSDLDMKRLLTRLEVSRALRVTKPGQHTRDVRIGGGGNTKWHVFTPSLLSKEIVAAEKRIAKRRGLNI